MYLFQYSLCHKGCDCFWSNRDIFYHPVFGTEGFFPLVHEVLRLMIHFRFQADAVYFLLIKVGFVYHTVFGMEGSLSST